MAEDLYTLKKVKFLGKEYPIIMQNINGPCPLIAICNILLLRGKIKIHLDYSMVSLEELMRLVGDFLMTSQPTVSEANRAHLEQNVTDALQVIPNMAIGLDVNVRFDDIDKFEYTSECVLFDALHVRLVHGWVVEPQEQVAEIILPHQLSYNQLIDRVVERDTLRVSGELTPAKSKKIEEGELIHQFLEETAHQLTYFGLLKLHEGISEGSFAVFFRNNHFSTIYNHKGELFLLVTDLGYTREEKIVWEKLEDIDGDSVFVDSEFCVYTPPSPKPIEHKPDSSAPVLTREQQEEQDLLLALQLSQQQSDLGPSELPAEALSTPPPASSPIPIPDPPSNPSLPDYLSAPPADSNQQNRNSADPPSSLGSNVKKLN